MSVRLPRLVDPYLYKSLIQVKRLLHEKKRMEDLSKTGPSDADLEHIKTDDYEQFIIRNQNRFVSDTQYSVNPSDYICIISGAGKRQAEPSTQSRTHGFPNTNRTRQRKSRVKSMGELIVEQAIRRNTRSYHDTSNLGILGHSAPSNQEASTKLQYATGPEWVNPVPRDARVVLPRLPKLPPSDSDEDFARQRITQILMDEGVLESPPLRRRRQGAVTSLVNLPQPTEPQTIRAEEPFRFANKTSKLTPDSDSGARLAILHLKNRAA